MHRNKDWTTGHYCDLCGISMTERLSYLYTNACNMWSKQKEWGMLQGSSHSWSAGCKLWREARPGWQGGWFILHVRKQQRWMELCLGMYDEPAERLYVRLRGQANVSDVLGIYHRPFSSTCCKKAHFCWHWSSLGRITDQWLISVGRVTQQGKSNPGHGGWSVLTLISWHTQLKKQWEQTLCWTWFLQIRKNWLLMWSLKAALAAVNMRWWSLGPWTCRTDSRIRTLGIRRTNFFQVNFWIGWKQNQVNITQNQGKKPFQISLLHDPFVRNLQRHHKSKLQKKPQKSIPAYLDYAQTWIHEYIVLWYKNFIILELIPEFLEKRRI